MTWSHPRGYDPMVATAEAWRARTGISIVWEQRSLQDFESFPVAELARTYDLIVIDHPHVGQITAEDCLVPLDRQGRDEALAALAAHSVGPSFASYRWQGRQWALPIDAATQVQVWRPDLLPAPLADWDAVMARARAGQVLLPLRPPHNLMCLYTLAGNLGRPCAVAGPGELLETGFGARVIAMLADLAALLDPAVFDMDPIAALEMMAGAGSTCAALPLSYGYVSYAQSGFRPHRLAFADMPVAGTAGPVGSALGGTGIAVSAVSPARAAALDYAFWVASGPVQAGLYAAAGGQPGHALAWEAEAPNVRSGEFYRATRRTLEGAWVRPRHHGAMAFQQAASVRLDRGLRTGEAPEATMAALNTLFRESFR